MRDRDFGVIRVGGRGSYSFRVEDAPKFMREIFGTNREYSTIAIEEYLKSIIVSNFANSTQNAIAKNLTEKVISFDEYNKYYNYDLEVTDHYDTDTFYKLMTDIANRNNFNGNPKDFYESFHQEFTKGNAVKYISINFLLVA